jgi:hypothetical protein
MGLTPAHYGYWSSILAFRRAFPEVGMDKAMRKVKLGLLVFGPPTVSKGWSVKVRADGRYEKIPAAQRSRPPRPMARERLS